MLTTIKRFFMIIVGLAAFVSVLGACSAIEQSDFALQTAIFWMVLFIACVVILVILDRPTRLTRYFSAAHICILAWIYLHNFTYNKYAKYCAVMKHRYRTYSNLYRRVVAYYKYELDDGEGIFQ